MVDLLSERSISEFLKKISPRQQRLVRAKRFKGLFSESKNLRIRSRGRRRNSRRRTRHARSSRGGS